MGRRVTKRVKSLPVFSAIDIQKNAGIIHRQLMDGFRMRAKDRPATDIAGEVHQLRKNRAVEQNRIAAKTTENGDQYLRSMLMSVSDHLVQSRRANERLVGNYDECSLYRRADRRQAHAQRCPYALLKIRIHNHAQSVRRQLPAYFIGGCTQNENDLVHT